MSQAPNGHFEGRLRALLNDRPRRVLAADSGRPAAVLVPLYRLDDQWQVLLTERTHTVAEHRGQVAFPGGRADPDDSGPVDTALRETEEEIGLPRDAIEVVGLLDEALTITDYQVTPVVGILDWPHPLTISEREISRVFGVPLPWLAEPAHLEVEYRDHPRRGPNTPVYFFRYDGQTIWGTTARILKEFIEVIRPILLES